MFLLSYNELFLASIGSNGIPVDNKTTNKLFTKKIHFFTFKYPSNSQWTRYKFDVKLKEGIFLADRNPYLTSIFSIHGVFQLQLIHILSLSNDLIIRNKSFKIEYNWLIPVIEVKSMSDKTTVAIVYGGKSPEHDVSLQTAFSAIQAIDKEKYNVQLVYITRSGDWLQGPLITDEINDIQTLIVSAESDASTSAISPLSRLNNRKEKNPPVVLPLLHGANGEDGTVQGLFELLDVPYVGANVLASAVAMDKVVIRDLFQTHGFAQPQYLSYTRHDLSIDQQSCLRQVKEKLGFPCFVKPANAGSSVGISKCHDLSELEKGVQEALRYDHKVIIEEAINGREVEIGIIGNDEPKASVAGEIAYESDFYDYESKYHDEKTELIIPARIPPESYEQMKEIAIKAYKAINCTGLARIDFFYTDDHRLLINEINTLPGFTPYSMFPQLWAHSGLPYPKLIDQLIEYALEHYENKKKITYITPKINK